MNSRISPKFCLLFLLLGTTFYKSAQAACASKEWMQYKEEKCVRILDSFTNQADAELICAEQNSTLLSIASAKEQEFLGNLLFFELGTVDNVWLGAVRVNSTATFQWTDGSPWTFDHWKEGSPSDVQGDECVQMVPRGGRRDNVLPFDAGSAGGLWSNVACAKRNLVVCQKRPIFSMEELTDLFFQHRQASEAQHKEQEDKTSQELKKLEMQLTDTKAQLEEAKSQIYRISQNPVPLGFVYTQLSGQPEPAVIWPSVKWTQVTQDYAGLFFRAEGGNSSGFGQVQKDESPRLSRVVFSQKEDGTVLPREITVPERGASDPINIATDNYFSGAHTRTFTFFLSFHNSGGEVRPTNQAIRLWKRTA